MRKLLMAATLVAGVLGQAQAQTTMGQTKLPTNAVPSCAVSQAEIDKWGSNGVFKPADSTSFNDATDCNFYKWGAQMFLWITSSSSDGTLVYNGPSFFDISFDGPYGTFETQPADQHPNYVRAEKDDNDTGVAQTGGNGVLISPLTAQTGNLANTDSIVHYGVKANNVYAYYRTGQFSVAFDNTLQNYFPTDANDLKEIKNFAQQNLGVSEIPDSDALAIELKSSWVQASILGDVAEVKKRYITSEAQISTFNGTGNSSTKWPQTGTTTELMAMVGLHVVGSVKGHPEMVWATFEHIDNAPQNSYNYLAIPSLNQPLEIVANVPYDGIAGTNWTFNADPVVPSSELPVKTLTERSEFVDSSSPAAIAALSGQTIGPDTVVRLNPWGDAPQTSVVPIEADAYPSSGISTPLTRATDLVSLNSTLIALLGSEDVRANYIQTGSIWSTGGTTGIPTSGTDPKLRGNLQLANATMETYHQYPDSHSTGSFRPKNCFGCHSISSENDPGLGVSHLFSSMLPLNPSN